MNVAPPKVTNSELLRVKTRREVETAALDENVVVYETHTVRKGIETLSTAEMLLCQQSGIESCVVRTACYLCVFTASCDSVALPVSNGFSVSGAVSISHYPSHCVTVFHTSLLS